ncbi:16S rRNA (guanine(527)-N(7))-methyltransferase RsmG [Candidatus Poribacteria bacterium]|nr:16S rRNA (guanine(527)-N(7))-methyltransferase RsmG [Candidatus Poribacteria bacterium]
MVSDSQYEASQLVRYEHDLKETFNHYGFPLTERQVTQFNLYRTELLRWNERINLTAITDDDEIVHKHFLDSLSVLEHISLRSGDSVVDIGTGAGFPGIVLKIYMPDIRLTLIESSKKKVSFLKFIVAQLNRHQSVNAHQSGDVKILAERAEICAQQQKHIGAYDWVFTRYVAPIRDSAAYCIPLLKLTGKWVAYKSGDETIENEISNSSACLEALGGIVETVLKNPKFNRNYVVIHRGNLQ